MSSDHIARNRAFWDADSDAYQEVHGDELAAHPLAWGAWRRPESELHVLGDVAGQRMLELGCGGAQWAAALAAQGATCIGLDLSAAQLRHARAHVDASGAGRATRPRERGVGAVRRELLRHRLLRSRRDELR